MFPCSSLSSGHTIWHWHASISPHKLQSEQVSKSRWAVLCVTNSSDCQQNIYQIWIPDFNCSYEKNKNKFILCKAPGSWINDCNHRWRHRAHTDQWTLVNSRSSDIGDSSEALSVHCSLLFIMSRHLLLWYEQSQRKSSAQGQMRCLKRHEKPITEQGELWHPISQL